MWRTLDKSIYRILDATLERVVNQRKPSVLSVTEAATLLSERGHTSVSAIAQVADMCRQVAPCGDHVTYVINRNINFTNACTKACGFCAFSRTGIDEEAYFLPLPEIIKRAMEASSLDATEICVQAGLPPNMNPDLYVTVANGIKTALPHIHLHAFSPEEVLYGAKRRKCSVEDMIRALKDAGVDTLPGTSAEILDDSVRQRIAKGRLTTEEWIHIISSAHALGVPTTATVMYGHVETPLHVAAHIGLIRDMQIKSKRFSNVGFTEFVPLSFVAKEAPMYKNRIDPAMRSGPSGQEVILTHAVSRLMLAGHIDNIQVSWVKEGFRMAQVLLDCGVNDLGGTLMNESISVAAGAGHGQLASPADLREIIRGVGRVSGTVSTEGTETESASGRETGIETSTSSSSGGRGMRIPVERRTDYTYRRIYPAIASTADDHPDIESSRGLLGEASEQASERLLSEERQGERQRQQEIRTHLSSSSASAAAQDNHPDSRLHASSSITSSNSTLDTITNAAATFGSFDQLRKASDHRFKSYHKQQQQQQQQQPPSPQQPRHPKSQQPQKRDFSTSTQRQLHSQLQLQPALPQLKSSFFSLQKRDFSCLPSSMRGKRSGAAAVAAFSTASAPARIAPQTLVRAPISSQSSESTPTPLLHPATIITYSSSHTLVPTYECFNSCTYCNFRINVRGDDSAMLPLDRARTTLQQLQRLGKEDPSKRVDEILILSGEIHPRSARRAAWFTHILNLCHLALEHGFLPHTNAGPLSWDEMSQLGQVNASMGLMLEQSNPHLAAHRFAPNKDPSLRKEQLRQAGRLRIPFTTGMLIGIGESHEDRLQTLSDIAAIAREYQHIQEVILQPYSPASDKMARTHVTAKATTTTTTTTTTNCSNTGTSTTDDSINDNNINNNRWFDVSELPQLVLLARDILPANVVIQIPPNLILSRGSDISSRSGDISSRSVDSSSDNSSDISSESSGDDSGSSAGLNLLHQCLLAGARDLGGVSPIDEVNPTYRFPSQQRLQERIERLRGQGLKEVNGGNKPAKRRGKEGEERKVDCDEGRRFVVHRRLPVHDRLVDWAREKKHVVQVLDQLVG